MGFTYTDAVFKANLPSKPSEAMALKGVLLAIAWYANNKTGICWPSHAQVARAAGCAESSAKKFRNQLKELGLVEVKGKHPTYGGYVDILKVNLKRIQALAGGSQPAEGDSVEEPGREVTGPEDTPVVEQPTPESLNSSPPSRSAPAPQPSNGPKPGIGPGIVNQELKPGMKTSETQADTTSSEDQASPSQPPASNTRDFAPHPTEGFSPPDPPAAATQRQYEKSPAAGRHPKYVCQKCGGPVRNNKIDGVCLKCGFDPNRRTEPYIEPTGVHNWPVPLRERTNETLCVNGCGTEWGDRIINRENFKWCSKAGGKRAVADS
jgi:hypothetical protein